MSARVSPPALMTDRERRREDKRLRESEERYRALVTATAQIVWTTDRDGRVDDIPSWRAFTGQSKDEVAGQGWLAAVHPDDRATVAGAWRQALATASLFELEQRVRRRDGVYRWFAARAVPLFDDAGAVREWVGASTDITERKKAEEERAESLAREREARAEASARAGQLEAVFDALADGVIVYDHNGRAVRVNRAARRLFALDGPLEGYSVGTMREPIERFSIRDEHGRLLTDEDLPIARILRGEVLQGKDAADIVISTASRSGVQLSVSGAPVRDEGGRVVGAVTILYDVTERRGLERRTHEALDALLAMAASLVRSPDDQDNLEPAVARNGGQPGGVAGAVARRLAELTRSVLGCARATVVAVDAATRTQHPLAVVGLSPRQEQEFWAATGPGGPAESNDPAGAAAFERLQASEAFVLDMTSPPFRDRPNPFGIRTLLVAPMRAGDRYVGYLALDHGGDAHDYSRDDIGLAGAVATLVALVIERERLLREAAEARAQGLALGEANRRMDDFLGIASHELKTPLTSIKGNIQLARQRLRRSAESGCDGDELAAVLAAVDRVLDRSSAQIGRMNNLVDDLLDVSRIQQGHLELRSVPCDLGAVVADIVEEQRALWPARVIEVERGDAPVPVYADPDRIGQVVTNFVTNALKYSDEDRPVRVGVARQGGEVCVRVRDEGPGLTVEEQGRLWERFQRVHGVAVRSGAGGAGGGIGLGLYISKMLVEEHQGRVGIESVPGAGSTFYFCLPLRVDSR